MLPTGAIIVIVLVVILGLILGYLQYNRPNFFRIGGGSEKILLGAIPNKRQGTIDQETLKSVS